MMSAFDIVYSSLLFFFFSFAQICRLCSILIFLCYILLDFFNSVACEIERLINLGICLQAQTPVAVPAGSAASVVVTPVTPTPVLQQARPQFQFTPTQPGIVRTPASGECRLLILLSMSPIFVTKFIHCTVC